MGSGKVLITVGVALSGSVKCDFSNYGITNGVLKNGGKQVQCDRPTSDAKYVALRNNGIARSTLFISEDFDSATCDYELTEVSYNTVNGNPITNFGYTIVCACRAGQTFKTPKAKTAKIKGIKKFKIKGQKKKKGPRKNGTPKTYKKQKGQKKAKNAQRFFFLDIDAELGKKKKKKT